MSTDTQIKVRCHYDGEISLDLDAVLMNAAGREPDFAGMWTCAFQRELGWVCGDESEATELRQRLATCPEVTVT